MSNGWVKPWTCHDCHHAQQPGMPRVGKAAAGRMVFICATCAERPDPDVNIFDYVRWLEARVEALEAERGVRH